MRIVLATIAALLAGCASAPQPSVALGQDTLGAKSGRIGVAMTSVPKTDTQLLGAGCLLCMATASIANSSLTSHAHHLTAEDLPKLKNYVADLMRKKGTEVTLIEESINLDALPANSSKGQNIAKKDFSSLQAKYGVDKLLVINITALGFMRTYSAYIPTSDPKGFLEGTGYLVNLKTNTYEWYLPVTVSKASDGAWDEPPEFPGLTNAYFQALEIGKDSFTQPFKD